MLPIYTQTSRQSFRGCAAFWCTWLTCSNVSAVIWGQIPAHVLIEENLWCLYSKHDWTECFLSVRCLEGDSLAPNRTYIKWHCCFSQSKQSFTFVTIIFQPLFALLVKQALIEQHRHRSLYLIMLLFAVQTDRMIMMHPNAAKLTHSLSVYVTQLDNPWPTYCIWMWLCLVYWSLSEPPCTIYVLIN